MPHLLSHRHPIRRLLVFLLALCLLGLPSALADEPGESPAAPEHPFPRRLPAPSFEGGVDWLNTAGPIDLDDLRGKFVLLDFWTYCCINCIHVLPELKKLEQAYPNELVVIGVHSAKFATEQESENIAEAIQRYEIEHPVVNDAQHLIWNRYRVNSWPSIRLIDPEGNLVAGDSGEFTFDVLNRFMQAVLPYYREQGLLDETPVHFDLERFKATQTPLRYPGKILADAAGQRLFIADSNHNRLVVAHLDGTLIETIGSGAVGRDDGDYQTATFDHPQGMALWDDTLYVADTENHLLRKVDLASKRVETIAGLGEQSRFGWPGLDPRQLNSPETPLPERFVGPPLETALNSPWALWIHEQNLYVAMAGPHQIWKMPLDQSEIGPYAGNGREDIVDGPLLPPRPYEAGFSSFAQPSGLASDGTWLYVADSEGSSIRAVPFDPQGEVRTLVGTAHLPQARLFTFGDVDGEGREVRLQHALGVVYHNGLLYIADTYNHKIKSIDPESGVTVTLAGSGESGSGDEPAEFHEPAGITAAGTTLYVADTNNHRIRTIDLADNHRVGTLDIRGLEPPAQEQPRPQASFAGARRIEVEGQTVRPAEDRLRLTVEVQLPVGYKINPLALMSYRVVPDEAGPWADGAGDEIHRVDPPTAQFEIDVPLQGTTGEGQLSVFLAYYYCQEDDGGLCKMDTVEWQLPVTLQADAVQGSVSLTTSAE